MRKQGNEVDEVAYKELLAETIEALSDIHRRSAGIIGDPDIARRLVGDLRRLERSPHVAFVVPWSPRTGINTDGEERLRTVAVDVLIIAEDSRKEAVLRTAADALVGLPEVVLAGYGHFNFRSDAYDRAIGRLTEPSLANGYPNSRVHLFQCLENAVRRGLRGSIVEFGMFRGGTTQFLREACRELAVDYPIIGFDTFDGFPPRRHLFDLYSHPDLAELHISEVSRRLRAHDIRIVQGDIAVTAASELRDTRVVLAFIDTDNYTSGKAAISSVVDRVVSGAAIVFDHYTGTDRFKRTIGERLAAEELLGNDPRYFNLHGTGVFLRQG